MSETTKDKPLVGVVMGSDSDLPIMQATLKTLEDFGVPYEVRVISAHRVPDVCATYASSARDRGIRVLIAAAGLAAHLPGVVAAHTTLPVIGVPIGSKHFGGLDALYSIVQMPPGIPVATVAVDGARNAAILAVQILAMANKELVAQLSSFKEKMATDVLAKDAKLQQLGYAEYLKK